MVELKDFYHRLALGRAIIKNPANVLGTIFDRWQLIGQSNFEFGGLSFHINHVKLNTENTGEIAIIMNGFPNLDMPSEIANEMFLERDPFHFVFKHGDFFDRKTLQLTFSEELSKYLREYAGYDFTTVHRALGEEAAQRLITYYPSKFARLRSHLIQDVPVDNASFNVVIEPRVLGGNIRMYGKNRVYLSQARDAAYVDVTYPEFTVKRPHHKRAA
ncbi:hypothetical protein [Vibrio phage phiKT1028]|nr:hypothetical protein [Vibrio phage phiKT1028]